MHKSCKADKSCWNREERQCASSTHVVHRNYKQGYSVDDHGAETHFAFGHALVRASDVVELVGFLDDSHLALAHVVQRLVEILGAVLLAPEHAHALHDEVSR